ncbi:hypothetical protein B0H13DRAFT_2345728 [Mycena leptocephala]|nr:hypothetical protein B0H13DRAFT_2345728 [Mycena leptocephala]
MAPTRKQIFPKPPESDKPEPPRTYTVTLSLSGAWGNVESASVDFNANPWSPWGDDTGWGDVGHWGPQNTTNSGSASPGVPANSNRTGIPDSEETAPANQDDADAAMNRPWARCKPEDVEILCRGLRLSSMGAASTSGARTIVERPARESRGPPSTLRDCTIVKKIMIDLMTIFLLPPVVQVLSPPLNLPQLSLWYNIVSPQPDLYPSNNMMLMRRTIW